MKRNGSAAGFSLAIVLATGVGLFAVNSGGSAPSSAGMPEERATPEQLAGDAFNSGVKHLDTADKATLKADAPATKPADAVKAKKQALDEYGKALKDFQKAVQLSPKMYRAHNGLGYAYRKTGDYTKALESYSTALQINPDFADAIEYRGEAYLWLNRTEDAKQAYLKLFSSDRTHADTLMKAMKSWVEKRHADPAGLDPAALTAFEGWMNSRAELADRTINMALATPQASWR
jgi:tetratricopeptide (TPR) repeat protein